LDDFSLDSSFKDGEVHYYLATFSDRAKDRYAVNPDNNRVSHLELRLTTVLVKHEKLAICFIKKKGGESI
jgi:hypothetical protein